MTDWRDEMPAAIPGVSRSSGYDGQDGYCWRDRCHKPEAADHNLCADHLEELIEMSRSAYATTKPKEEAQWKEAKPYKSVEGPVFTDADGFLMPT